MSRNGSSGQIASIHVRFSFPDHGINQVILREAILTGFARKSSQSLYFQRAQHTLLEAVSSCRKKNHSSLGNPAVYQGLGVCSMSRLFNHSRSHST